MLLLDILPEIFPERIRLCCFPGKPWTANLISVLIQIQSRTWLLHSGMRPKEMGIHNPSCNLQDSHNSEDEQTVFCEYTVTFPAGNLWLIFTSERQPAANTLMRSHHASPFTDPDLMIVRQANVTHTSGQASPWTQMCIRSVTIPKLHDRIAEVMQQRSGAEHTPGKVCTSTARNQRIKETQACGNVLK